MRLADQIAKTAEDYFQLYRGPTMVWVILQESWGIIDRKRYLTGLTCITGAGTLELANAYCAFQTKRFARAKVTTFPNNSHFTATDDQAASRGKKKVEGRNLHAPDILRIGVRAELAMQKEQNGVYNYMLVRIDRSDLDPESIPALRQAEERLRKVGELFPPPEGLKPQSVQQAKESDYIEDDS